MVRPWYLCRVCPILVVARWGSWWGWGLRNCCRVLLGLVTEPWPANDGRNDGANLSCIYHVSILTIHAAPAGAGRGGGGTTDPPTTSHGPHNVWTSLHHVALVAVKRCCEINKYLLRKIVSIYTAKCEVKYYPPLNMILLCVCKHFRWLTDWYIQLYD